MRFDTGDMKLETGDMRQGTGDMRKENETGDLIETGVVGNVSGVVRKET